MPWLTEWIQELHQWQELVGSALGVIGAFGVAWWAASHSSRRDVRNAAFEIIQDLVEFGATTQAMLDGEGMQVHTDMTSLNRSQRSALGMVIYRPKLSAAFFVNAARLRLLDPVLVTRLSTVRKSYEAAEAFFTRLEDAERRMLDDGDSRLDEATVAKMLNSAYHLSSASVAEANATAADLERLFVKRWSWVRRLVLPTSLYQKRRLKKFQEERGRMKTAQDIVREEAGPRTPPASAQ